MADFIENEEEIKKIRKYLLSQIKEYNSVLRAKVYGFCKSNRDYQNVNTEILDVFAYDRAGVELDKIERYQQEKNKNFARYCYFDIPTLCAYERYLNRLIDFLNDEAKKSGHVVYPTARDFGSAKHNARKFLEEYAGQEESGFYSKYHPIRLAQKKNESGKTLLDPMYTPKFVPSVDGYSTEKTAVKNYMERLGYHYKPKGNEKPANPWALNEESEVLSGEQQHLF